MHMALTKAVDSMVTGLTVSVLPSRYRRVMEASYVRQNLLPASWDRNRRKEGVEEGRSGGGEEWRREGVEEWNEIIEESVYSCILSVIL